MWRSRIDYDQFQPDVAYKSLGYKKTRVRAELIIVQYRIHDQVHNQAGFG